MRPLIDVSNLIRNRIKYINTYIKRRIMIHEFAGVLVYYCTFKMQSPFFIDFKIYFSKKNLSNNPLICTRLSIVPPANRFNIISIVSKLYFLSFKSWRCLCATCSTQHRSTMWYKARRVLLAYYFRNSPAACFSWASTTKTWTS